MYRHFSTQKLQPNIISSILLLNRVDLERLHQMENKMLRRSTRRQAALQVRCRHLPIRIYDWKRVDCKLAGRSQTRRSHFWKRRENLSKGVSCLFRLLHYRRVVLFSRTKSEFERKCRRPWCQAFQQMKTTFVKWINSCVFLTRQSWFD